MKIAQKKDTTFQETKLKIDITYGRNMTIEYSTYMSWVI